MINRILIRSKVVQIAYSYFLTKDKTVMDAEKELFFSFEKSYELYHLLLTLMVELTDTQAARVEAARMKFLATPEEKNPNMRFVNNRFIEQLRNCKDYKDYHEKKPITWTNDPEFLRDFSERIVKSDLYKEYMEALKAVRPERNAGAKRGAELTDKEIEESIEKNFETRQKRLDVEKTYYKKFKSVLNARQLKQLFGRNNTQRFGVKPANLRSNKIGTAAMARLRPAKKVHPAKAVTANGSAAQAPTK